MLWTAFVSIKTYRHVEVNQNGVTKHKVDKSLATKNIVQGADLCRPSASCQCSEFAKTISIKNLVFSYTKHRITEMLRESHSSRRRERADAYYLLNVCNFGCLWTCRKWWTSRQDSTIRSFEVQENKNVVFHICMHMVYCFFFRFLSCTPLVFEAFLGWS